jgi:hypothetical protein
MCPEVFQREQSLSGWCTVCCVRHVCLAGCNLCYTRFFCYLKEETALSSYMIAQDIHPERQSLLGRGKVCLGLACTVFGLLSYTRTGSLYLSIWTQLIKYKAAPFTQEPHHFVHQCKSAGLNLPWRENMFAVPGASAGPCFM